MFATNFKMAHLGLSGAATLFGLAVTASTANADHNSFGISLGGYRTWAPPVYETVARTIELEPVCEDFSRQVWHEPVYEDRRTLVTRPARVETRRVARFSASGRFLRYETERFVVEPPRREWVTERVLVRPGYYKTVVDRVCREPETRVVYDQVLVRPGRWEPSGGFAIHAVGNSCGVSAAYHDGPYSGDSGFGFGIRVRN